VNYPILTLTHATLNQPIKLVFGPGVSFFRSAVANVTVVSAVGGGVHVIETPEVIEEMLNRHGDLVIPKEVVNGT
jgi:hypothetical protein